MNLRDMVSITKCEAYPFVVSDSRRLQLEIELATKGRVVRSAGQFRDAPARSGRGTRAPMASPMSKVRATIEIKVAPISRWIFSAAEPKFALSSLCQSEYLVELRIIPLLQRGRVERSDRECTHVVNIIRSSVPKRLDREFGNSFDEAISF